MPGATVIWPGSYCAQCGGVEVRWGFCMRTFPGKPLHFFVRAAQTKPSPGEVRLHLDCGKPA